MEKLGSDSEGRSSAAREVRYARLKTMFTLSISSGMKQHTMAVDAVSLIDFDVFPSSIVAKRPRLRRKETAMSVPP